MPPHAPTCYLEHEPLVLRQPIFRLEVDGLQQQGGWVGGRVGGWVGGRVSGWVGRWVGSASSTQHHTHTHARTHMDAGMHAHTHMHPSHASINYSITCIHHTHPSIAQSHAYITCIHHMHPPHASTTCSIHHMQPSITCSHDGRDAWSVNRSASGFSRFSVGFRVQGSAALVLTHLRCAHSFARLLTRLHYPCPLICCGCSVCRCEAGQAVPAT